MRNRGIVVSLLCSLSIAPLLVPGQAGAVPVETGQHTIFDTRAEGMPTTAEAWRTLEAVSGETEWRTGEVAVTASLAAPVPAGSSVSVTWTIGHWSSPGVCAPEQVLTATPADAAGQQAVSATRTIAGLAHDYTCLDVSLTTQGAVTDRMRDGWVTRIAYSGAEADLVSGSPGTTVPTKVLAGRLTKTLALVTSHVLPSDAVTVTGSGTAGIEAFAVTGLAADEVRPVVARVLTLSRGRFRVELQARDERGDADYDGESSVKAIRVNGRPEPGTFRSSDGAVRFTVDRSFRVRKLVGTAGVCGSLSPEKVRMSTVGRLPRTGATAVSRNIGGGWSAVSLVTTGDRSVSGVLVRTTPGCTLTLPFVARLAR